jgi:hypothetical protein
MAYNPFNIFRRNQKALFAVLTVFIMIMFTLSFGKGDFFDQIPRWLGASGGEVLCKIDGHKVTTKEVRTADFKRKMANRYMSLAASQSVQALSLSLREQVVKLNGPSKEAAELALQVANAWLAGMLSPRDVVQLPVMANAMSAQIESPTARGEEKEAARTAQSVFLLIHKLAIGGGGLYFLNAPDRNERDLIEFLLWQKKADQLGINFTHDDVVRMVAAEFYGAFKSDVEIRKALQQQMQGFTMESCWDAIGAEFRVRAAQTAVMGQASRYRAAPAYPTPYEAFEFYRQECSPAIYQAIPVPAAGFVGKVQGQPTDAEIRDLFDKYQNDEPNPKSETPGFKEPRKISVEWIGLTGEEPYYKKIAEQQVKLGEVMGKAYGALTVPLPGAGPEWFAAAAGALTLKEPAVAAAYESEKRTFQSERDRRYGDPNILVRDLLDSSVLRPGVLAATAGGFVGQAVAGNPLAAVSVAAAAPIAYEVRDRVKVGLPLVLGGVPGPGLFPSAVAGVAAAQASEPQPPPIDYLRPELLKTTIDARAKAVAFRESRGDPFNPTAAPTEAKGDIPKFIEELGKMASEKKDRAAIEKYVQDFIAGRGLTLHGKSGAPRDEWHLEDDPGLAPLVKAQKEGLREAGAFHSQEYIPFGQSFFWTTQRDPTNPFAPPRRGGATSGNYQAAMYPPGALGGRSEGKVQYVVWRTEDVPAKKASLVAARPAVVEAWKRMKARDLARAQANSLAEQIRAAHEPDPFLLNQFLADEAAKLRDRLDPGARNRAEPFTISGVAPLVPSTNPLAMLQGGAQLQPFELKPSENIPYPTPEMQKELLDNRDKPMKTVLVLPDAPKDTFYVATLMRRDLKTPDDFRFNVYSRTGRAQEVRGLFQQEAADKARKSVLELLKKEFNYQETDEQKKKLDENEKSGNRE